MTSPKEAVAIAELVVYVPLAFITLFIAYRHKFVKQLGWIYLNIFCAIRIAGAALEIASVKNPKSVSNARWAAILGSIALSPLLLTGFELLKTLNNFISPKSIRTRAIHLLHVPCILALVLSIIGGIRISSSDQSMSGSGSILTKAGGIIFLALYIIQILLAFLTMLDLSDIPLSQRQIYVAVLVATPFLGVRVLYSLMVDFAAGDEIFSFVNGNIFVKLGMAIIMEVFVAVCYTIAGLRTALVNDQKSVENGFPWGGEQAVPLRNVSPDSQTNGHNSRSVSFVPSPGQTDSINVDQPQGPP